MQSDVCSKMNNFTQKRSLLQKRKCFSLIIAFLCLLSPKGFAQGSTKIDFKPLGKISCYAFGDYAYKFHAHFEQRGNVQYSKLPKDYNSFNFRRGCLGYDYQFTPNISFQLLLVYESTFEARDGNPDILTNTNRSVYIKAVNIRFKNEIPRATTQQLTKNKLNFFARLDFYNPDAEFEKGKDYTSSYNSNKETFATIGLDFVA